MEGFRRAKTGGSRTPKYIKGQFLFPPHTLWRNNGTGGFDDILFTF